MPAGEGRIDTCGSLARLRTPLILLAPDPGRVVTTARLIDDATFAGPADSDLIPP
jgi:hypothetical protein